MILRHFILFLGVFSCSSFFSFAQQAVVKWGDFAIAQINDTVIGLNWSTQLELNVKFYQIERSTDDKIYTKIGELQALGNSLITNKYVFLDKDSMLLSLPTTLFYKITPVGIDGENANQLKGAINHLQQVNLPWNIEAPLYPNPFKNYFRIKFTATFPYPIKLSILKTTGETVQEENIDVSQNSLVEVVTLNLNSGSYIIRLQYENAVQYLRAVKN